MLDATHLEAEVRRLRNENQLLTSRVKCDVIQEDVLAKFQVALQPLHERVAAGAYSEDIDRLEIDILEVYETHIQAYDERASGFHADAVQSQREDLVHGLCASLRRVALSGLEVSLTQQLEDATDEVLLDAAVTNEQPQLWPRLARLWEDEAQKAAERVRSTLVRLGCAEESAVLEAKEADELRASARAVVAGRLDNPVIFLPELLRRAFDTQFRYQSYQGTLRVTGPFTDLDSLYAEAMARVHSYLDEFSRPLAVSLPQPSSTIASSASEDAPLVDWRARDRFERELRVHADDLFETQATKQLLLRGTCDLPLGALVVMLFLGYDHILATLLHPLKLAALAAICVLCGATIWARRLGLIRGKCGACLDSALAVATLGVCTSMRVKSFYASLAARRTRGKAKGGAPADSDGSECAELKPAASDCSLAGPGARLMEEGSSSSAYEA